MEHKSDTMFDIVQNLAKEITMMKNNQPTKYPDFVHPDMIGLRPGQFFSHPDMNFGGEMCMEPMGCQMSISNEDENLETIVEELEDDKTDGESDEDDSESDEDDSDGYNEDYESDSFISERATIDRDEGGRSSNSDQAYQIDNMEDNFQKIKVEDDSICHIEVEQCSTPEIIDELDDIKLRTNSYIEEDVLHIEENIIENQEQPQTEIIETTSISTDDYKKMSLNELKKLVSAKGKDTNKLKRNDLLKILVEMQTDEG